MNQEFAVLENFIRSKTLRYTPQREKILGIFLSTERHVSASDLYKLVRKEDKTIGYTTVYRALKLFSQCGLCEEIDLGDGLLRFEHKLGHKHHDHLICTKCGRFIEVRNPRIEKLQDELARQHYFLVTKHKLDIFGICRNCST